MNQENFIGTYQIDTNICDQIINFFDNLPNKYKQQGMAYEGEKIIVDPKKKESLDIFIPPGFFFSPFREYEEELQKCLDKYCDTYKALDDYSRFNLNSAYNVQWYPPGGGFKVFHSERGTPSSSKRVLVFMTYLNDVEDGGTEFLYFNLKTKAKKGMTLIWPTDFTHQHRGIVSNTKSKYIVTGWYHFNEVN